ncbi:peptidylprolyl isomerase [Myxococcus sp. CA051A]|uniref:Peptidyl-prolyl cis-trans isomerase n=1 Tax=Myxococcus llanfairpwllgwyngyllgogerychwyrndrobwllllantysiliogogogochensis TaxID=2590453 RepID=A0A540WQE4_9BACT|nr:MULTISPECIES: peptidylprolyl isomerase [Myxococcus]NTX04332.1 peptidylprolyl isomerase [Myxococcus sp. CA040A]NTX13048.1 peptidylprolyl isomerase [Myxococcus sp. CA056]NTX36501.1 peptidylprolyl isomerase [Myxococcus sp. CA033]NTX55873.1 peptidylprolyl isomerase [Myxococcus sp. CA039A]NTX64808.1 peptidylprolyl isomerase [Myxococcus sp. CA051A]
MRVTKDSIVSLEYRLHLGDGQVIDQSAPDQPLAYLHGHRQIVPGLEGALEGLGQGDSKQVVVQPAQGYGEHDPEGVRVVPRSMLPPGFNPQPGQTLMAQTEQGDIPLRIQEVRGDDIVIDLNHPLAGKTLHFDVTVKDIRQASSEELSHGHVHGAGGHDHGAGGHDHA